jgi:hypothetical protein
MQSLYHTGNILRIRYKAEPVYDVWGNSHCLLWEPYGTHRYTVWEECRVCTTQETYYVSDTKPNQYMIFGESVVVYCEKHTEHTDTLCGQNAALYHTGKPLRLHYKAQPANAHWRSSRCLLWETYGKHRYTCRQNVVIVPHRKHITTPIQSPTG